MHAVDKPLSSVVWRDLRHEWLWVYRGKSATEEVWSPKIIVPAGVFFVETGHVSIRVGGVVWKVLPGQAFFSAPGPREHHFARGTRLCSVGIRNLRPDGRPLFEAGLNRLVQEPEAAALLKATLRLFRTVHGGKREVLYHAASEPVELSMQDFSRRDAAFLQWFAVYVETLSALGTRPDAPQEKPRARVDLLLDWLNGLPLHKGDPSVPPGLGIGTRRADQLLRGHTGMGMRTYLIQRRLVEAKKMLIGNSVSIKEIGFLLGFRHASHFTIWFRRHEGVSPSAFKSSFGVDVP